MCRDGADVAKNSSSGGCEGCVPAGERRFFLVASGAEVLIPTDETDGSVESPGEGSESSPASIGICLPVQDRGASSTNDLHGCGGLGQPESPFCAPLLRRMNFADCALTNGVWWCGVAADRLQEARVVTKPGPSMGGALCCRT